MVCLSLAALGFDIKTKQVTYKVGNQEFKGFVASPKINKKKPGILIVHEWWGHNEYANMRAKMLAKEGYVALALDMYGDGKLADHPEQAGEMAKAVTQNMKTAESRFKAALDLLKSQPDVNPEKIAAIGYCFGGGIVLEMMRRGVDLDAVASFHGSLGISQGKIPSGKIKTRVLVFNGADDKFVAQEDIEAFKHQMDEAKINYTFVNYPNAVHSFTNQDADKLAKQFGLPLAYNKKADKDSWKKTMTAFKSVFSSK